MDSGLHDAAFALTRGSRLQDIHAENIANATVPGYRRQRAAEAAFHSHFEREAAGPGVNTFLHTGRDFTAGEATRTDNPYDVAINGPGFFAVEGVDGTAYTRNGAFTRAADGTLQTQDGMPVLGEGGAIVLDPEGGEVKIDTDGTVLQGENSVGRLRIVEFDEPYPLVSEGTVNFSADGSVPRTADRTTVHQGYRERSNVNLMEEMVSMMGALRHFEMNQKVITTLNDSIGRLLQSASGQ